MFGILLMNALVDSMLSPRPVVIIRRRPLVIEKTRTIVIKRTVFVDKSKKEEKKTEEREIPVE